MMARRIEAMSADQLWRDWCADIERICKDSYELFTIRRQFREIAEMYQGNEHLQRAGANLWLWLRGCYVSTIVMRLRRETDDQGNAVSLPALLAEIEARPDVVTRERIAVRNPNVSPLIRRMIDEGFTKNWAEATATETSTDRIDTEKVRADRVAFEKATFDLDRVASQTLAHRPRAEPSKTSVDNVAAIFDLFEELLKKYLGLLIGTALLNVEPTAQYDTLEPFTFPWHPKAYAEWVRLNAKGSGDPEHPGK
jgi:hypothetical protein